MPTAVSVDAAPRAGPTRLSGLGAVERRGSSVVYCAVAPEAKSDAEARAMAAAEAGVTRRRWRTTQTCAWSVPARRLWAREYQISCCCDGKSSGGVAISGGRDCKIRHGAHFPNHATHRSVKDSEFNVDPEALEKSTFSEGKMALDGTSVDDLEREIIPCPFVQVPLNVMEDRLLVVTWSSRYGRARPFEPGLLAKAHRGVLYVTA